MNPVVVIGIVITFVLVVYVLTGIKMVRPFERGVVERLGKYRDTVEPGLRIIVPFIERITVVDMREQVVDVPPQGVITSDNAAVEVDAVIYYEATDAQRLVYNVGNFLLAITKLAQTNLRNVVGDMQLDEALTSRDKINLALRDILDDATDKWGVRVVRVELQRVEPPPDVTHSMHEVMRAERNRRATVTEALGVREAAITRAEGEKAAAVLESEGAALATRQIADAERYRQETVAEGEAAAIRNVFQAIHDGDATPDILALKYYEALQVVASGQATKIFLPAGADGFANTVAGLAELVRSTGPDDRPDSNGSGR
jgi:regulator of protease activity HflC (stomatin/prohibitin superfamily)